MGLEIFWTGFARNELKTIFDYYSAEANPKIARRIVKKIVSSTSKLGRFHELGQIEGALAHRPQQFRYIVRENYKLIYWVNHEESRIEIVDVFDTRQNPLKISRNTK